jgi:toxin CcdB
LNPAFQIEGEKVVMVTQFMAAIPAPILKLPVHNLADSRHEIVSALDLLFQGF